MGGERQSSSYAARRRASVRRRKEESLWDVVAASMDVVRRVTPARPREDEAEARGPPVLGS